MDEHVKTKMTPKDFFVQLGIFASLYISLGSLVGLLYEIIDHIFPDLNAYGYNDPYSSGMRFAIASLIIIFPAFIFRK